MRYYVECLHAMQGVQKWERISISEIHDQGFQDIQAAREVGGRLLRHPLISGYRICDAEAGNAVVETH